MLLCEKACDYEGCERVVRGRGAYCSTCDTVHCREHRYPPFHICHSDQETEKESTSRYQHCIINDFGWTLSNLDPGVIRTQATTLRPGHTCVVHLPEKEAYDNRSYADLRSLRKSMITEGKLLRGDLNLHFKIEFDDGVVWLIRCRAFKKHIVDMEAWEMVTDGEIATMQMARSAGVLVPEAVRADVADRNDEKRCSLYFFVEYIHGSSFPVIAQPLKHKLMDIDKAKYFIESYAKEMIKLSSITFDKIGSLYNDPNTNDGTVKVGPMISVEYVSSTNPYFLGPFKTGRERYLAQIDHHLSSILNYDAYDKDPVEAYLIHLEARDIIRKSEILARDETEFYITHVDGKGATCFGMLKLEK